MPDKRDTTGPLIFCSGASAERARDGARRLVSDGAAALLSFGLAGGLDPALEAGRVVLADYVVTPNGRHLPTDGAWRERLLAALGGRLTVVVAPVVGSEQPVLDPQAKRTLFEATSAAAVDMESHAVADVAREAELPFLVLRAIADPVGHRVPRIALAGLGADGRTRPGAVLRRLLVRPWEGAALLRIAADSARGLTALRRVARLGPSVLGLM